MLRTIKYFILQIIFLLSLSPFGVPYAQAQVDHTKLLSVEEAFIPTVTNLGDHLLVEFKIAQDYYLYQDKITLNTNQKNILSTPKFENTRQINDDFFGKQMVLEHKAKIYVPFIDQTTPHQEKFTLTIGYQGCYAKGVCYPPTSAIFNISGSGTFNPIDQEKSKPNIFQTQSSIEQTQNNTSSLPVKDENQIQLISLLTFFASGIALSFTACMYPLLPILSSIIVGNNTEQLTRKKGFLLSLSYTQGMALTYTAVGVITGLTGSLLTVWLQQPAVILTASLIMVILAFGMFDVISIQIPNRIQHLFTSKSQQLTGGKIGSVFVMGMFSALIVGPCVAPPLAVALGYIGQTKNALLGGGLLYMMALGMGVPLLIVGTFGAQILPKSGYWMNTVKHFFGIVILGLAIYLAAAFIPLWLSIILYSALLLFALGYTLKNIIQTSSIKIKSILSFLFLILISVGSYFTYGNIFQKITPIHQAIGLYFKQESLGIKTTDVSELKNKITLWQKQYPDKPIILDFYADWCVSCKEMEAYTFSKMPIQKEIVDNYLFIQIDVTKSTKEHQALLKEYGLFGPPAIFVLHKNKNHGKPLIGFANETDFLKWLKE